MLAFFIGASATPEQVPCRTHDEWDALFDAAGRKDVTAVLRIIETPPTMLPRAALRNFPEPKAAGDMGELSRDFWRRYAEKHPKPTKTRRVETSVTIAPASDPASDRALRHLLEGGK